MATVSKVNPTFNPQKSGSSTPVSPYPYIGFVKKNDDPQHMGRLQVWIPELCGDPTNESSWIMCSYCSSFAGHSDIESITNYQTDPNASQQSYGMIAVPPDLNAEVMVIFVNGETSRAYWIGCTLQQNMSQMLPGIGSAKTVDGKMNPVLEYNKAKTTGSVNATPSRPTFTPLSSGLDTQGSKPDTERGSSTTSMQRESPPKMYGLLSPRGNNMHIDDDSGNEFIRMRTRSGAQILVHETTGYVYINSKTGNSWIEIADNGIGIYSHDHVSIRTQGDFNVHADGNINLDAGGKIQVRSGADMTMDAGGNLGIRATGTWKRQGGGQMADYHPGGHIDTNMIGMQPLTGSMAPDATQSGDANSGGWSSGGSVNTITSKTPTHEPWTGHPKSSVPAKPAVAAAPASGAANGATLSDSAAASKLDSQQSNTGA